MMGPNTFCLAQAHVVEYTCGLYVGNAEGGLPGLSEGCDDVGMNVVGAFVVTGASDVGTLVVVGIYVGANVLVTGGVGWPVNDLRGDDVDAWNWTVGERVPVGGVGAWEGNSQ